MKTAFQFLLAASCSISLATAEEPQLNSYPSKPIVGFVLSCTKSVGPNLYQNGFPPYQAGYLAAETCACLMDEIRKKFTYYEFKMINPDKSFTSQDVIDCLPNNLRDVWNYSTNS